MSVFLWASLIAFVLLCLLFIWAGNVRPNWKTVTVSLAVGLFSHGVSLLF